MINRVTLVGRLVDDPAVGATAKGSKRVDLRLEVEHTSWSGVSEHSEVRVRAFGERLAEVLERYLSRGRLVQVDGYLRAEDGGLHVVLERFQFMRDSVASRPLWVDAAQTAPAA